MQQSLALLLVLIDGAAMIGIVIGHDYRCYPSKPTFEKQLETEHINSRVDDRLAGSRSGQRVKAPHRSRTCAVCGESCCAPRCERSGPSCLGREEFNRIGKCFKEEQQCTALWRTSRELGWV